MLIFPSSPMPAGMERLKHWGEDVQEYDSGEMQGISPYAKPLYEWSLPFQNYTEIRQSSLWSFYDAVKGRTTPFLIKDAVNSGPTSGSLYLYDTNSYMVRADTTTIGSLFSALSGYVRLGTNYNYDQDNGIFTITTKANTDTWGVRSMQYFRKARFMTQMREASPIWNVFKTNLTIKEQP
jgi:hypothetical protein